jgi:hypothetical protein
LLLTFYVILKAYLHHSWRLYLASFLLTYLSVYVKQNNLILLAPMGLALMMSVWRQFEHRPKGEFVKYGGIFLIVLLVGVVIGWVVFQFNPFAAIQAIYSRIFLNSYVFGGYHMGFSGYNTPQWLVEQFFTDPRATWRLVALLALPGILPAIRLKEKGWLLFSVLLPYLLMVSLFTVRFAHWLVPLLPFLAWLAALTIDWFYETLSRRRLIRPAYLSALFYVLIFVIPGASIRAAITLNYYGTQRDVRQVAEEWLEDNLPRQSKVVVDSWGPYLDPDKYQVLYVSSVGEESLEHYRSKDVNYIIINSFSVSRLLAARLDPRAREMVQLQVEHFDQIVNELPLERRFVGPALFTPPVVDVLIYRLQ